MPLARSWQRWLPAPAVFAFAVTVAFQTVFALSSDLWDDALFFQRIGRNIVHHGVAAWNVADGPVHGSTSQLFQMVAAAVVAIAPHHYHLAVKILLGAALVCLLIVLGRALPHDRDTPREEGDQSWARLAVLLCGLCAPTAQLLIASGMETLVAMLVLAVFLLVLLRVRARAFGSRPAELAAFTGAQVLVYLARPDMVIVTFLVAAIALYEPSKGPLGQRRLLELLALSLAAIAALLGLLRLYYGTAFPLSFYLKSRALTPYDEHYLSLGVPGEQRQLLTWLAFTGPFAYVALFRPRQLTIALLAGAAAFVAYHHVSTVAIMGYHTRFLLPATVPVLLAAALAWPSFVRRRPWWKGLPILVGLPWLLIEGTRRLWIEGWKTDFYLGWLPPEHALAFAIPTLLLFLSPLLGRLRGYACETLVPLAAMAAAWHATQATPPPSDLSDEAAVWRIAPRMAAMTGIDVVRRCVREPTHIYHSELGVPGVLFPESKITDLSGLMNPRLVFERSSFDEYCLADSARDPLSASPHAPASQPGGPEQRLPGRLPPPARHSSVELHPLRPPGFGSRPSRPADETR